MKERLLLVIAIIAAVTFSCTKEKSCEGCINGNNPPIALAGKDQIITLPTDSVELDGSASNDPDGRITAWQWKKIIGPASFNIANASVAKTTVKNLASGVYQFELVVSDDGGLQAKDTVQVTVNSPGNHAPIANAGRDTIITLPANTINLDGSASTDSDNNISTYQWTQISGPVSFTFANANATQTQVNNLTQGTYLFELKVTDATGLASKDTVQVIVNGPGNRAPVANAGIDTTITLPSITINLDGSASSDPDNNIISYQWTKISGPSSFAFSNANATKTQVNNLTQGTYLFELKVTDAGGLFSKDTVQVTVQTSVFDPGSSTVYVAGWGEEPNAYHVAKLWKNGAIVQRFYGNGNYYNGAVATSIFLSGSDVYITGSGAVDPDGNTGVATLWKNSVRQDLTPISQTWPPIGNASSVFVSGIDVYVAGDDKNTGATLWKNGVAQSLSNYGSAYSVFVSGSDVYVAGCIISNNVTTATLWKNGVAQILANGGNTLAISVFVSGNDIYVAGVGNSGSTLWKNGVAQILASGVNTTAWSVFVSGSDVYVVGNRTSSIGTKEAILWKNGVAQILGNGQIYASAYSVFVSGSDVYVAGSIDDAGILWKNGVAYTLQDFVSAYSVFVK